MVAPRRATPPPCGLAIGFRVQGLGFRVGLGRGGGGVNTTPPPPRDPWFYVPEQCASKMSEQSSDEDLSGHGLRI